MNLHQVEVMVAIKVEEVRDDTRSWKRWNVHISRSGKGWRKENGRDVGRRDRSRRRVKRREVNESGRVGMGFQA